MNIFRVPLTKWSSVNTPSGNGPWGEFGQLGREILDHVAGRRYKFVQIGLSGVSAYEGVPVVYTGQNVVTPDVSDATVAATNGGHAFAGILCTSTTIVPDSGSTAYGWIMCQGPLGKIAGSLQQDRTLKTYFSNKGGSAGKCYYVSSGGTDGVFRKFSTGLNTTTVKAVLPNLVSFASSQATSAKNSVSQGFIRSYW